MELFKYSIENFSQKLEALRKYRGYKTQAELCRELTISRQHWCNWINNNQYPSLSNLMQLANFFQIDIKYFFLADAIPEKFDPFYIKKFSIVLPEKVDTGINNLLQVTEDNLLYAVECKKYPEIRKHLRKIAEDKGFFFIEGKHYQPETLEGREEKIVIISDCEKLSKDMIQDIVYKQYLKMQSSFFLFGKNIRTILDEYGFSSMFDSIITLNTFSMPAFRDIVLKYLPDATDDILLTINYLTNFNLTRLSDMLIKIKAIPDFQLTTENLVNFFKGIET